MRLKYAAPLLTVVLLLFAGCMSSDPLLFSSTLPDGGKLYYLPVTPWKAGGDLGLAEIRLDITCRTSGDQQGTVNISFFGRKDLPGEITALVLGCDGFEYPLHDTEMLLERPEQLELRLTAAIPADALKRISPGENIYLAFSLDGRALQSPAPKEFYIYARQLDAALGD
ncbi:MAG: hypothetical protein LBT39_09085 [Treponema sp.]|jgi:hypothetical protein|nr:hypothetical protein [Treponema sp.]